jgi:hypothetical protein
VGPSSRWGVLGEPIAKPATGLVRFNSRVLVEVAWESPGGKEILPIRKIPNIICQFNYIVPDFLRLFIEFYIRSFLWFLVESF